MTLNYSKPLNIWLRRYENYRIMLIATLVGVFIFSPNVLLAAIFDEKSQVKEYCVSPANIIYLPPSQIQIANNITGQSKSLSAGEESAVQNLLLALQYWFEKSIPMQKFDGGMYLNYCGPRAVTIRLTLSQYQQAKVLFEDTGVNFHELNEIEIGNLDLRARENLLASASLNKGNMLLDQIAKKALNALVSNESLVFDQPDFLGLIADFDQWWNEKVQIHPDVEISPRYFSLRSDTVFGGGILSEFQFLKNVAKKLKQHQDFDLAKDSQEELVRMRSSLPIKLLIAMQGGKRPMEKLIEENHLRRNFIETTPGETLQYLSRLSVMIRSFFSIVSEFQINNFLLNASTFEVVAQLLLMEITQFEKQGATEFELADALEVSLPLIRGLLLDYDAVQPLLGPKMHKLYEKIASLREHTIYGYLVFGVTPDLLDTVKGSRLSCTRSDFAFQEQSAGQHDYNLQTIPVEV